MHFSHIKERLKFFHETAVQLAASRINCGIGDSVSADPLLTCMDLSIPGGTEVCAAHRSISCFKQLS